ncbi:MAG: PIG-L family deacetylase [Acidimicrobiales bacterium]|nr:PIG-L family deacetylase [Acidimicrobiales bacterium]
MSADPSAIDGLGTILGVWAHPDDEAYLMAGTAMRAMDRGVRVTCVTATAGEAGETADEERWPQARLAEIRRQEMADSLAVLGIDDHEWLHLPDGALASIDPQHGVDLVTAAIDRVRPDTILTFGPDGMTGHPDHVTVGEWATRAVAESGVDISMLAATKIQAWYDEFPAVTAEVFPDGGPCAAPGELVAEIEIGGEYLDRKVRALGAQASQTAGLVDLMGAANYRTWNAVEYWVDITPA